MNDRREIYCNHCGHRWVLIFNYEITSDIYLAWAEKVVMQHKEICGK